MSVALFVAGLVWTVRCLVVERRLGRQLRQMGVRIDQLERDRDGRRAIRVDKASAREKIQT